jgi:hypothetical protein
MNTRLHSYPPAILLMIFLLHSLPVFAGQVVKVKDGVAVLDVTGMAEDLDQGSLVYGMLNGKNISLLEVTKLKGGRALARLKSGAPVWVGMELMPAEIDAPPLPAANIRKPASSILSGVSRSREQTKLVLLLGIGMNWETVKGSSGTAKMSGSGYDLSVSMDYWSATNWSNTLRLGTQNFSADGSTGSVICNYADHCISNVSYLMADFFERLRFENNQYLQIGAGLRLPLSSSTNFKSPKADKIAPVIELGYGAVYKIDTDFQVPVELAASYLFVGSGVSAYALNVRGGLVF